MRRMLTASKPSAANSSRAALIARARNSASRSMLRRGRPRTAVLEDFRFDVARFIAIFFSTRTTNRSEPSGGTQMIRHGVAAKRLAALAMAGTLGACGVSSEPVGTAASRSEEHTSELQSLMRISYAVFCLKKKKQRQQINYNH